MPGGAVLRAALALRANCCETPAASTSSLPAAPAHAARNLLPAGNYRVLPSVIEEELVQPGQRLERPGEVSDAAAAEQRQEATRRIDFLLRSKLLAVGAASVCGLPLGCTVASCDLASRDMSCGR